jgi:hypothetical protein
MAQVLFFKNFSICFVVSRVQVVVKHEIKPAAIAVPNGIVTVPYIYIFPIFLRKISYFAVSNKLSAIKLAYGLKHRQDILRGRFG